MLLKKFVAATSTLLVLSYFLFSCQGHNAPDKVTQKPKVNAERYYQTVVPEDTTVTLGDTFHSRIYLSDYPVKLISSITIDSINGVPTGGFKLPIINGTGIFSYKPIHEGTLVFIGRIEAKEIMDSNKVGKCRWRTYFFRGNYVVAKSKEKT